MPSRALPYSASGAAIAVMCEPGHSSIRGHVTEALQSSIVCLRRGTEATAWLGNLLTGHLESAFSALLPDNQPDLLEDLATDAEREFLRITVNLGIGMLKGMKTRDLEALIAASNGVRPKVVHPMTPSEPFRIYTLSPQLGGTHLVSESALSHEAVQGRLAQAFPAAPQGILKSLAPMMFPQRWRGRGAEVVSWANGVAYSPDPRNLAARAHARLDSLLEQPPMPTRVPLREAA
jgi:hypothetical protein